MNSTGAKQVNMAAEMAQIRPLIASAIGCSVCASGIAIDAIGERYGFAPFDSWRCKGERCEVRKNGLSANKSAEVRAIIATLPAADVDAADHPAPMPDSRLPVERDDETGAF